MSKSKPVVSKIERNELDKLPNTSARIRALFASGHNYSQISKILGIRPQHARNVVLTPVKNPKS